MSASNTEHRPTLPGQEMKRVLLNTASGTPPERVYHRLPVYAKS